MSPKKPNLLITGTPGTGKTTIASEVATRAGLEHIDVSAYCKQHGFILEYDQELDTHVIDEDRLIEGLEPRITKNGGFVIDYHGADLFPESWLHRVVVLRTDNTVLFDRLTLRGYGEKKLKENLQCEIFQTILEETKEAFKEEVIEERVNDKVEDKEKIVDDLVKWCENWKFNSELV